MTYAATPMQHQLAGPPFPRRSFWILISLLIAIQMTPPAIFFFSYGTSEAPGLTAVSAVILLIAISRPKAHALLLRSLMITGAIAIVLLLHGAVAAVFQAPNAGREYGSIILEAIALTAAMVLGPFLFAAPSRVIRPAVTALLGLYVAIALASLTGLERGWNQPVFPFTEPSHFAIAVFPILLTFCIMHKTFARVVAILIFFLLSYIIKNLTLAIVATVVSLICLPVIVLAALGAVAVAFLGKLSLDYFTDRLNLASDTQNYSALVYKEGWELTVDALTRSGGWGIGFQQLGQGIINSASADKIRHMAGFDLNLDDGGFVAAKLIAELGYIGVALTIAYTVVLVRSALQLRQVVLRKIARSPGVVLALSYICGAGIEMFVRTSSGYFSATLMMFVAALSYFYSQRRHRRSRASGGETGLAD